MSDKTNLIDPINVLKYLVEAWKVGKVQAVYFIVSGAVFLILVTTLALVLYKAVTWPDGILTHSGYYNFDDPNALSKASNIEGLEGTYIEVRNLPLWGDIMVCVLVGVAISTGILWNINFRWMVRLQRESRKKEFTEFLEIMSKKEGQKGKTV